MDLADDAAGAVDAFQAESLARCVGKSKPETHPDFNGADCVACLEAIPAARLALGRVRCVECQEKVEHKAKWGW